MPGYITILFVILFIFTIIWSKTSGELQELITTLYIGFLGLIFSSYFVYLSEKEDHFKTKIEIRKPGTLYFSKLPMAKQSHEIYLFCGFECVGHMIRIQSAHVASRRATDLANIPLT
jgi:hypothetical protein